MGVITPITEEQQFILIFPPMIIQMLFIMTYLNPFQKFVGFYTWFVENEERILINKKKLNIEQTLKS